jgi:ABC-type phosphate transport system auxiliary subunit
MIESIKQISEMADMLMKQHEQQLSLVKSSLGKIKSKKKRLYLEQAFNDALSGKLNSENLVEFINEINKWQQK